MSTKFDDEFSANYATLDYVLGLEDRMYRDTSNVAHITDSLGDRLTSVEQIFSRKLYELDSKIDMIGQRINIELFEGIIDRVEKYLERKEAGYITCDDEFIDSLKSLFEGR